MARKKFRQEEEELTERVVDIARTSKVVKGGRNFSFRTVVVVGDGKGRVGIGIGKANEVPNAIRKGIDRAKKDMIRVPMIGRTIPHEVTARASATKVLLRPASSGTGVIAGGGVRAVLEAAGVKDILTKSLGSANILNVVKATFEALKQLRDVEEVARLRGRPIELVSPPWASQHLEAEVSQ